MKNKLWLCMVLPLLMSCHGQGGQKQTADEEQAAVSAPEEKVLKGEEIPIDTVLFRYAYRMRVQGDKAVIFDLHNADYYFHVFTYPDFGYVSSFGKRGEGPEEMTSAENVRFAGKNEVWVLDNGKNRMSRYGGIAPGEAPRLEETVALDQVFMRALDFDMYDAHTAVIPDYSGENRFSWAQLPSGRLLRKSEQIPVADVKLLEESAPAVAQGWNSRLAFSPDKRLLVTVTQFGERLDIYDLQSGRHIGKTGEGGDPDFKVAGGGYAVPGGICYYDVQVTDRYIYALYDGRKFKDIMKEKDTYKQGGRSFRVFSHDGKLLRHCELDRPLAGFHVDESRGMLYGMDVNADEQLVKYSFAR